MAFLIMNRDVDTARDRLLEIFWPDAEPDHGRDSLNTALWSIRRCLRTAGIQADECVLATKSTVRWTADTLVDSLQFAELAASNDLPENREALQLYRGDFLEGDYDNWAVTERERLATIYETVLARVVRTSKDTEAAQRFIARNPYDEEAYATIVEAELAAGRRSSAASWVERCRNALSEVGEKPSPAFEARFGNIAYIEPLVVDELTLPFAGREAELALLATKFSDTAKGRGSITLVRGEAGIGKSSLLSRAAQIASQHGLRVLAVRCAREVPTTFGPWQDIFNAVAAGEFDAFVRTHGSDVANAVAYAIAARLPEATAIIVDDAHELTAEALDIFVALGHIAIPKHSLVAGLRPEGVSILRSRLTDVPFEEVSLGRLDRSNLKWALAQALGSEQPDVLNILYERTGGHPLFFAGLLNSLVAAGALARDGHRWQLTKPIDANIELPDTVRRFIEARLHTRGDAPRTLAGALALEPAAKADDLIAVLRMDESSVLDALDDLLALGLIMQPAAGTQFAFTHDLVREVAAAGLNAGRRTALHRSFAERLKGSVELQVSLRLARHLSAAGDYLSAAQSYLKSAHEALELNAPQDAIDRCDAGVQAAERLERTAARDVALARLQTTAARAAIAGGNVTEATRRARVAVTLARAAGDLRESAQAILDLALIEGAALHVSEQKSNAAEAAQNAKLCGDETLEAQALVQQANAARDLGLRDEALRAAHSARDLALKGGHSDVAQTALEELLRTQLTWWMFGDALETARIGLDAAKRAEPLAEASFLQIRSMLWCLLERFDEAQSEVQAATHITNETLLQQHQSLVVPIRPLALLQFACHYMTGKIAIAQKKWDKAIDAAQTAAALTNVAILPRYSEALALLRIDALLQRNSPGDSQTAYDLTTSLGESTFAQGSFVWGDCVELARARAAARLRMPVASTMLRRALNTVEENAHRVFLESDRAFARLAEAAAEVGEAAVADQARARYKHYRSRRLAAAGAAWGGTPSM
ncbi:MAG: AAA family ATPase [Candidatus Eremiobacteraeota bacterium]|nr:AAA family ATPase [Candidatus Eremiobacteraeota bacterium]